MATSPCILYYYFYLDVVVTVNIRPNLTLVVPTRCIHSLFLLARCLYLLNHLLDGSDNYIHRRQCAVSNFSARQGLDLGRHNLNSIRRSLAIPKPLNRCQLPDRQYVLPHGCIHRGHQQNGLSRTTPVSKVPRSCDTGERVVRQSV
jgi:hypothetical protein